MLRDYFPSSKEGSEIYGGFMIEQNLFCRKFAPKDSNENMLLDVNKFLIENGYKAIEVDEIDKEDFSYNDYPVSLSLNAYLEEFVLQIWRDPFAKTQTSFLISELKSFRDDRDWEQFHNAKDLSIALSIEANELLELFLWKSPEDANKDKLKEELADVFAYALLLADKLEFDVEKIVLEKIKRNGEKYPVDKAKGNAKKYNEL